MSGGMYLAAAGALVQQLRLEMLANNVANINTIGYKAEKAVFSISDASLTPTVEQIEDGNQVILPYAPPFTATIDFSQGSLQQTDNPLDVAINGSGFFSVQTPEGVQYTRQGNFTLDEEGQLVTSDGFPVLGEGGEITLDAGTVEIDAEGTIYLDGEEIDRLQVTDFAGSGDLKKAGNGRFMATDTAVAGERSPDMYLSQGYLESANVNTIMAMTEMIETSRAFEAYQKIIQSADEATSTSINDVGATI